MPRALAPPESHEKLPKSLNSYSGAHKTLSSVARRYRAYKNSWQTRYGWVCGIFLVKWARRLGIPTIHWLTPIKNYRNRLIPVLEPIKRSWASSDANGHNGTVGGLIMSTRDFSRRMGPEPERPPESLS